MSVPLDQIYNYLNNINNEIYNDCVLIYSFCPHGSKKLENLIPVDELTKQLDYFEKVQRANMIMYDQEPLQYDQYQGYDIIDFVLKRPDNNKFNRHFRWPITETTTSRELDTINVYKNLNLRFLTGNPFSVFDLTLLTHSEKNSQELKKYEANGFIGVYWWAHAIIARDWFRYYQHVTQQKKVYQTFLIYNRAWSGTREYRLKFAELLIRLGLKDRCRTNVNPIEPELGIHYDTHTFTNPAWRPTQVLENHFPTTEAGSWSSAEINLYEYESTEIEVVLETLFDDQRQQLTEKALRPIAVAQPFILASTAGSLEYLRSYGFKTFGHIWDERYDLIKDPHERLIRIADLMRQIANWDPETKTKKMAQAQAVADYNKKLFFSKEWQENVIDEYKRNFSDAMKIVTNNITAVHTKNLQKINPDSTCTPEQLKNRYKLIEIADTLKEKFS
jgi:hypothetical protein